MPELHAPTNKRSRGGEFGNTSKTLTRRGIYKGHRHDYIEKLNFPVFACAKLSLRDEEEKLDLARMQRHMDIVLLCKDVGNWEFTCQLRA